jgi:Xaa-Pro aminopeptidase
MRTCHIRDCAAVIKYFAWLENELKSNPDTVITEYDGARKVDYFRTEGDYFKGPSFDTISSTGPNGAVIHYKPAKDTALRLNLNEVYLLDNGGQYLDGTTDITRTVHFGGTEPTAFQKEMYTRVLLGNLDLERLIWPSNSTFAGLDFDAFARRRIWEVGLDYKHGTGHGVGSFLCVHEGPHGTSRGNKVKFEEGMCVSNEPGYYHDGEFGIRIENINMIQKHPKYADRFYFENLTVHPYCRELIDKSLLSQDDIKFIDTFH